MVCCKLAHSLDSPLPPTNTLSSLNPIPTTHTSLTVPSPSSIRSMVIASFTFAAAGKSEERKAVSREGRSMLLKRRSVCGRETKRVLVSSLLQRKIK